MKNERQMMILEIIGQENIETQEQLLTRLQERGVSSTQATISRDIKQMHLIKEPVGRGVYKYSVSGNRTRLNFAEKLRTIFRESITSIDSAQNIVVVKTMPGLASAACAALDDMNNETFSRIVSTRTVTVGGRTLSNHNKLLSYVDGCIGLKTGYTKAAGRTLVSCVRRNGQRLVAVTLQDGNDWADHAALYDYGFSTYPAQRAMTIGETVGTLAVTGGLTTSLPLVAADSFSWPLAQGEKLEVRFELPKSLCAPVTAGNSAGQAVFSLNGKEVGRVELLCGRDILSAIQPPASLLRHLRLLIQGG